MNRLEIFFKSNRGADALLLANYESADPNFVYFAGAEFDNSYLVAKKNGEAAILVSALNFEYAKEFCENKNFCVEKFERRSEALQKLARALGRCRKIGVNKAFMSARTLDALRAKTKRNFTDVSKSLDGQRALKDRGEIEKIRTACALARKIIRETEIKAGISERALSAELQCAALSAGAKLAFEPIVLSGADTRFPHGKSTEKRIRKNEIVLVDFGVRYENYCSDVTRCFFTGACVEEREAYGRVKETFFDVARALRKNRKCREYARLADLRLKKYGLPRLIHSLGHGVGLAVHESPSLGRNSKDVLRKNMAFALEPAFYGKKFGARYEDVLVMGERAKCC
ncbi:MAG: Xaa-Pro peptidase family protein [Candidatus Micrarchaeota archaeon]